jgi:hypothetical protein
VIWIGIGADRNANKKAVTRTALILPLRRA